MTERFARKVILAVKNGTERELFIRKRRKTAVDDNLRKDLEDYLCQPKISRNCPGESVSIAYRQRKEKHMMNISKEAFLQEFIEVEKKNYTVKTLLQYWPHNFLSPSSHERKRKYSSGSRSSGSKAHDSNDSNMRSKSPALVKDANIALSLEISSIMEKISESKTTENVNINHSSGCRRHDQ